MKSALERPGDRRGEGPGLAAARLKTFLLCVGICFSLLALRLSWLQLVRWSEFAAEADANAYREVHQPVSRGRILDRKGVVLATSRPALTVAVTCQDRDRFERRLGVLARATGVPAWRIRAEVERSLGRHYAPVIVARDVDPVTYTRLAETALELPEVSLGVEPVRDYPLGPAAAHLIGYTGEVSRADLDAYPHLYAPGDIRGLGGVEAVCDWLLRGEPMAAVYEVDATGKATRLVATKRGRPGSDVQLTVDSRLQDVAFYHLGEAMFRARRDSGGLWAAPGAALVALDPSTGAVLALVSRPSFDPAAFTGGAAAVPAATLVGHPLTPLLNRATLGLYAPGSTFKLVTACAALEEVVVREDEAVPDPGLHSVGRKKCWLRGGHGQVRLQDALAWSCNVFFYEVGLRLGVDGLERWAREFGLGEPSGLDLCEAHAGFGPTVTGPATGGEPGGTVPGRAWKAASFPDDPTYWPAEVMDAAIGQGGHTVTPLQMAVLTAALANGGTRWRPYVVDAVLDENGFVVARAHPEAAGVVQLSEPTLRAVREGMLRVAMDPGGRYAGTAAHVFGPEFRARWGVDVAGKTGTAEHGKELGLADDAWFVGWAPYDDPGIVVAVVVEQGGSGSRTAAPVARAVIEAWLSLAGAPAEKSPAASSACGVPPDGFPPSRPGPAPSVLRAAPRPCTWGTGRGDTRARP